MEVRVVHCVRSPHSLGPGSGSYLLSPLVKSLRLDSVDGTQDSWARSGLGDSKRLIACSVVLSGTQQSIGRTGELKSEW